MGMLLSSVMHRSGVRHGALAAAFIHGLLHFRVKSAEKTLARLAASNACTKLEVPVTHHRTLKAAMKA
jgi:hypothetical protein